jgi:hypothetical protein
MAEQEPAEPKQKQGPSKGGRKGGTIFPRIALDAALAYAKKLVSKTAVAAQPEATVLAGVFNNAGSPGKIRLSALKQFGLIEGTPAAYKATSLAKEIEAAGDDIEKIGFIRRAFLQSKVYRELYNTYQGDETTKTKIKGRAQQLGVHPDASEQCTDLFMSSAGTAQLATPDGDGIRLGSATEVAAPEPIGGEPEDFPEELESGDVDTTGTLSVQSAPSPDADITRPRPRTAADVTLNLSVDSSLDGDKLEKQLNLLRKFGLR